MKKYNKHNKEHEPSINKYNQKIRKIKLAIVGLGNCASSLIQGIDKYKKEGRLVGVLHERIGGYTPGDIEIVAAFDIDERKVGKDVCEAIYSHPNNTLIFNGLVHKTGVKVMRGPTLDGIAAHMLEYDEDIRFLESKKIAVDVSKELIRAKPDILICYLPVGSEHAAKHYAQCCLDTNVHFINAMPVFICSDKNWSNKFWKKGLICAGDDIKSQIGATIIHRVLTNLFQEKGVTLKKTYQINFGGNTDFLNMLDRSRLKSKKESKTEAVQSQLRDRLDDNNIHVGPSDFIPFLKDNKICHIQMIGEQFGGATLELDLKLSVEDSPNSAGVMIDAVRCVKLASERNMKGALVDVSAFCFKHPPKQYDDSTAIKKMKKFISE